MKRWLWIGGWGLPVDWQADQFARCWPEYQHEVFVPDSLCIEKLLGHAELADRVGGYSLGAFLLLKHYSILSKKQIFLLAPILDLKAELALGGRIPRVRLAVLLRWLKGDPLAALNDFYVQAGLSVGACRTLPYSVEDLIWGIEQLQGASVDHWRLDNVQALIGEADGFLNAPMMQEIWPELILLPDSGHDLCDLLTEAVV